MGECYFLLYSVLFAPSVLYGATCVIHGVCVTCVTCKEQHIISKTDEVAFTRLLALLGGWLLQCWGSPAPRRGHDEGDCPEGAGGGGGGAGGGREVACWKPPRASKRKLARTEQPGAVFGSLSRKPAPGSLVRRGSNGSSACLPSPRGMTVTTAAPAPRRYGGCLLLSWGQARCTLTWREGRGPGTQQVLKTSS